MRNIILIAHDIRSTHNVGSLLRTAEGLGVSKVYLTGYTPHPQSPNDARLPHEIAKLVKAIEKTALGAETMVNWEYIEDVFTVLSLLKNDGFTLCALEQTADALELHTYPSPDKCALIIGSEVTGVAKDVLDFVPTKLVIPMYGKKESFNVVQAAAMALFHLRFSS